MSNNAFIRSSAAALINAVDELTERRIQISDARLGHRQPVIRLSKEPEMTQLTGATRLSGPGLMRPYRIKVAIVHGCQVEWEV